MGHSEEGGFPFPSEEGEGGSGSSMEIRCRMLISTPGLPPDWVVKPPQHRQLLFGWSPHSPVSRKQRAGVWSSWSTRLAGSQPWTLGLSHTCCRGVEETENLSAQPCLRPSPSRALLPVPDLLRDQVLMFIIGYWQGNKFLNRSW